MVMLMLVWHLFLINFAFLCSGGLTEVPTDQPSAVVQPTVNISPQPATQKSATEFLSTSGTFEKVPSPAPESFEQISMSQMQESRVTPPASAEASVAAAETQLPTSTSAQPPVQTGKTLFSARGN